jgi:hypothetical protein
MADSKRGAKSADDGGQADLQTTQNRYDEQGYIGTKVDPLPNEAHSLESGPDAPTAVEGPNLRLVQHGGESASGAEA